MNFIKAIPHICEQKGMDPIDTLSGYFESLHKRVKWDFEMNDRKMRKLQNHVIDQIAILKNKYNT